MLIQRHYNPKLRTTFIPLLENDIINDPALLGFIEKYCKEEGKKELQAGYSKLMEAMLNDWGIGDEGLWRHQAIIEEIKKL